MTVPVPKSGGTYIEGMVGQPLYINPLISQTSEVDISLTELIYSGLFDYDEKAEIENELADRYELSEDKKEYTIYLKEGIVWHDGEIFDAQDVVFTINILKDPAYKSPLRQTWQGVEVEKVNDHTVKFKLDNPYYGFLDNLTLGILPEHIWGNVTPEKFALTDYNLSPIGTGPYEFSDFQKDSNGNILTYQLRAFSEYFEKDPYIAKLVFNFYPDEDSVLAAYKKREVNGMSSISPEKIEEAEFGKGTRIYEVNIPRYFSVFLNQTKSIPIANDEVREAITLATDKQKIVDEVLFGKGEILHMPFLSQMEEFAGDLDKKGFDLNRANQILEENGWSRKDDGIREKDGTALEIELLTLDWPELSATALILSQQWNKIGMRVNVKELSVSDLQQNYIRPREYDAILIGQATNFNPDPYSFWHSSQKRDPGLNLSLFNDENADTILDEARREFDDRSRSEKFKEFQGILNEKNPAVFLYTPHYLYPISTQVKGINLENINSSQNRFSNVENWYIKTKRVRK